jgi:uncharacterized membrane protein YeaQ/YmgE (transglycosylase-associated protein family)
MSRKDQTCIVVGGGLAGLVAATVLQRQGVALDVIIGIISAILMQSLSQNLTKYLTKNGQYVIIVSWKGSRSLHEV